MTKKRYVVKDGVWLDVELAERLGVEGVEVEQTRHIHAAYHRPHGSW